MTEHEAAMRDLAYANGMQAALVMAAQGAEAKARKIMERFTLDALRVLRIDKRDAR